MTTVILLCRLPYSIRESRPLSGNSLHRARKLSKLSKRNCLYGRRPEKSKQSISNFLFQSMFLNVKVYNCRTVKFFCSVWIHIWHVEWIHEPCSTLFKKIGIFRRNRVQLCVNMSLTVQNPNTSLTVSSFSTSTVLELHHFFNGAKCQQVF